MTRRVSFLILMGLLLTHNANAELYPSNAYYDVSGKVYYYATDGKAYYYPEEVQLKYQKKPQTQNNQQVAVSADNTPANTPNTDTPKEAPAPQVVHPILPQNRHVLSQSWWKKASPENLTAELVNGADVNSKNHDGWTPLMLAAQNTQHPELIKALIDAGADIHAQNNKNGTALMIAVGNNTNPEITKALIESGADVNAKIVGNNAPDVSALIVAAMSNTNPEITKTLVDSGADVNFYTQNPILTPAYFALTNNTNHEVFEALILPEVENYCDLTLDYTEEVNACKDKLTRYMKKEHKLPDCTEKEEANSAISPLIQTISDIPADKGVYTLVDIGYKMSDFKCSLSKTFKKIMNN